MRLRVGFGSARAWIPASVLAAGLIGCYFVLPAGLGQSIGYNAVGVGSAAAVLVGLRLHRPADRAIWVLLMVGSLCSVAADAVYTAADVLHVEVPTPSVADLLYLASYPLLFIAIGRIGGRGARRRSAGVWIDAAIIASGALALSWHLLMGSYARDDTLSLAGKVTLLAYPIMDIAIMFILVSAVVFAGAASVSSRLVAIAMAIMLVGDFVYDVLVQRGAYVAGNPVDATWLVNYALIGVAALHPSMSTLSARRSVRSRSPNAAPLVIVAGLSALGLLLDVSFRHDSRDELPLAVIVAVMAVLGMIRMQLLFGILHSQARRLRSHASRLEDALVERDDLATHLRHLAFHDALTGLPNRVLLHERLERAVAEFADHRAGVALLVCDLDGFKHVNDTLGHQAGDELLTIVAGRLSHTLRATDVVARLGGDEFAVLAAPLHDTEEAIDIAQRVLDSVSQPVRLSHHTLAVSASVGLALAGAVCTADQLLTHADAAMYEAKTRGRNRFTVYDDAIGHQILERSQLVNDMTQALADAQFHLAYQPLVTLSGQHVTGYEALARWHHPERGPIPPLQFIPLAEQTGLIVPLGRWILRSACATAAAWPADHGTAPTLGVNVSAIQLRDTEFVADVHAALLAAGLPADRLVLEITESTVADGPQVTDILAELRSLGVRIAIDDFGTGYSSLSQLRQLPADILKIDKSFVDHLGEDETSTVFVESIIRLAQHLGMRTVAEGVENRAQHELLTRIGCDTGQGYLFSEPVTAAELFRRNKPGRARLATAGQRLAPAWP